MSRLYVMLVGGLTLTGSALTTGQAISATGPRIRVEHVRTFGGGPLPGHLRWRIAVDAAGLVMVADTGYDRIQLFEPGPRPGEPLSPRGHHLHRLAEGEAGARQG